MSAEVLTRYIAEFGLLSFVAECLAMLTVFVLLGGVWVALPGDPSTSIVGEP